MVLQENFEWQLILSRGCIELLHKTVTNLMSNHHEKAKKHAKKYDIKYLFVLRVMIVRSSYSSYFYIDHNDIKSDKQTRSGGDYIMQDNNGKELPAHG